MLWLLIQSTRVAQCPKVVPGPLARQTNCYHIRRAIDRRPRVDYQQMAFEAVWVFKDL
jgi:hypothetical protein